MRLLLLAAGLVAACAPSELPHRPLVVDAIPYGANRREIRAWHVHHGWCITRQWPTTDEFERCDFHKEAHPTIPAIFTLIRYDDAGWSISYAVFAPVPLAWNQRWYELSVPPENELVDPEQGMYVDLADRLRGVDRVSFPRSMALALFEALAPELDRRMGKRTWEAERGFGATWETKRTEVGLFVATNGHWIIETHEIKPEQLFNVHLNGGLARIE